jgi:predicted RNA-binding Zn-ribbon protein involved in translation (DUF1610 family)
MAPPGLNNNLPCLNCGKHVTQEEAKVFAEVFVCPTCYELAARTYSRLEGELRRLLSMSKEAIRIALVEGKMQLPAGQSPEISKADLLKMIVQMAERKDARPTGG